MIRGVLNLCVCIAVASLASPSFALTLDELPIAAPRSEVQEDTVHVSESDEPIPTLAVVSLGPSSTAAITAAMLFPGAGHFYVGGDEAPGRGVGFLLGELMSLTAFVVASETIIEEHYFIPDEEKMRNPGLALVGLLAFTSLKIWELVDAGRLADSARMDLARQRPIHSLTRAADTSASRLPGTLASVRIASF